MVMSDREYFADLKKIYVTEALGPAFTTCMVGKWRRAACGTLRETGSQRAQDDGSGGHGACASWESRSPSLKKNMTVAVMSALFQDHAPWSCSKRLLSNGAQKKIFGRWYACTTTETKSYGAYYWSMSACSMESWLVQGARRGTA